MIFWQQGVGFWISGLLVDFGIALMLAEHGIIL